jgi:hypothetical protein
MSNGDSPIPLFETGASVIPDFWDDGALGAGTGNLSGTLTATRVSYATAVNTEASSDLVWDNAASTLYPNADVTDLLGKSTNRFKEAWSRLYAGVSQALQTAGGAVTLNDPANGELVKFQSNANVTSLALPAGKPAQRCTVTLKQNAAGSNTWPTTITNCVLEGGSFTKSAAGNAVDVLTFISDGTTWFETGRALAVS